MDSLLRANEKMVFYGYAVSMEGDVVSFIGGKRKAIRYIGKSNHARVYIRKKWYRVDKLVATAFVDNPEGYKYVGHRDGDLSNNEVSNLYWREDPVPRPVNVRAKHKEVEQIKDGEVLYCFGSVKEAGECMVELGLSDDVMAVRREISRCARGERRRVCGYEWRYLGHKVRRREMRELYEKYAGKLET